jgi:hypothetical protein
MGKGSDNEGTSQHFVEWLKKSHLIPAAAKAFAAIDVPETKVSPCQESRCVDD